MGQLTKRELDKIAKIYAGSILAGVDDGRDDDCGLSQGEMYYIVDAVIARGKRIVGNDQTFGSLEQIVNYVKAK